MFVFGYYKADACIIVWWNIWFLCEFDFEIKHIKGKENKIVDVCYHLSCT